MIFRILYDAFRLHIKIHQSFVVMYLADYCIDVSRVSTRVIIADSTAALRRSCCSFPVWWVPDHLGALLLPIYILPWLVRAFNIKGH